MKAPHLPSLILSSLLIALVPSSFAQDTKKPAPILTSDLSGGDMKFLVTATEQGTLQSSLSGLAASHAKSEEVKSFAETLAKEHAIQNELVRLIAIKKKFALNENLNADKSPVIDKLGKLQGLKFDKAYMEAMLQQEQNYVAIFEQAIQSQDPDIKSFAAGALPSLRQHLAFLQHTVGSSGGAPAGGAAPGFRVNAGDPDTRKN